MGQIAAQTVIDQIEGNAEYVEEIAIEPEFVVRNSTTRAPANSSHDARTDRPAIPSEHRGEIAQRKES